MKTDLSVRSLRYWTINPNQTAVEPEFSPPDPVQTIRATVLKGNTSRGEGSVSEKARNSSDTRDAGPSTGLDDRYGAV